MGRMLANKITLHGSPAIKDLENQIRFRFVADAKKKLNRETAIKRIFFGLNEDSEFDWEKNTGTYWAYFDNRANIPQLFFISNYPPITKLQEHIALCAAEIDPRVVVQLDYEDIDGVIIGTSLTAVSDGKELKTYHLKVFSPDVENRGMARRSMERIKSIHRNVLRKKLIAEMGSDYRYIELVKTIFY